MNKSPIHLPLNVREELKIRLEADMQAETSKKFFSSCPNLTNKEIFDWFYHLVDAIMIDALLKEGEEEALTQEQFNSWFLLTFDFRDPKSKDRLQRFVELYSYKYCVKMGYFN